MDKVSIEKKEMVNFFTEYITALDENVSLKFKVVDLEEKCAALAIALQEIVMSQRAAVTPNLEGLWLKSN